MNLLSSPLALLTRFHKMCLIVLSSAVCLFGFSGVAFAGCNMTCDLPPGQVGVQYSSVITPLAPGIVAPFVWSITALPGSSIPPGMDLVPSGDGLTVLFKGTPLYVRPFTGDFSFEVAFTDARGLTFVRDYTHWRLYAPTLTLAPEIMPFGSVGVAYSQAFRVTSAAPPSVTWSMASVGLAPGLSLDPVSGVLSGTPTVPGSYTFRVVATDASRAVFGTIDEALTITTPSVPLAITTLENPIDATVGVTYPGQIFRATGGTAPYYWYTASPPAPGLVISTDGILTGVPTAAGTYSFRLKVRDAADTLQDHLYTVTVVPAPPTTTVGPLVIDTDALPAGTEAQLYATQILRVSGGTSPYNWSIVGGLPPGMTLSSSGVLTGTPTTRGTYTMVARAMDSLGTNTTRTYTFTVLAPSTTGTPPTGGSSGGTGSSSGGTTLGGGTSSSDVALTARLSNLSRIGVSIHGLVKLPDDGNRLTQADSAVYYLGADGRRHAFPNDKVYFTWYADFSAVRVISAADLASIPLGTNVTYKPGVKLIKFLTDPKVYAVSTDRQLRWVKTESIAISLYGSTWNRQVDDVSDTFYLDYRMGTEIGSVADYSVSAIRATVRYPSDVLPML